MLNCPTCNKSILTQKGLFSHWKQVHDPNRKIIDRSGSNNPMYGCKGHNQYDDVDWSKIDWQELGHGKRRERLLFEANYACTQCGFDKRRVDGGIILEIDHIDGNHMNNAYDNLRILCPNCHALTPNFRNWGGKHKSSRAYRRKK